MKGHFEQTVKDVLEQVEWLWGLYELQPRAVAGHESVVPPKRVAPADYVATVQAAVEVLFDDLPVEALRDLALQLDASDGKHGVMSMLREKAAPEHGESDVNVLGILSELFEWMEKGEFYIGESN